MTLLLEVQAEIMSDGGGGVLCGCSLNAIANMHQSM